MSTEHIDRLSPQDAYQLGVLDERIRRTEQEREEFLSRSSTSPMPSAPKPKKPKNNGTPTADAKQPALPHAEPDVATHGFADQSPASGGRDAVVVLD